MYTIKQCIAIVQNYLNTQSYVKTKKDLYLTFPDALQPTDSMIKRVTDKFLVSGSV
jgi:hypothetical protein